MRGRNLHSALESGDPHTITDMRGINSPARLGIRREWRITHRRVIDHVSKVRSGC
jgi:hypothetical protein